MELEPGRWPDLGLRIEIWEEDVPAFFACLCLGMLQAIRAGAIAPEVGIFRSQPDGTLQRPRRLPRTILPMALRGMRSMNVMRRGRL